MIGKIHSEIKSLYQGPIRTFTVKTGIHNSVHRIYGGLISTVTDDIQEHSIDGVTVSYYSDDYAAWERQRSFEGETPVMEQFASDISADNIVWDVGANMGTYACLASCAAERVSVVSFEPAPTNIERLERNLDLNGSDAIVRQEALDKTAGTMGLATGAGGDGQYALTDNHGEIQVPTVTADSLVKDNIVPSPDIVKIDVEGAEIRVLEGMEETLKKIERLYIEIHPPKIQKYGDRIDELDRIFSSASLEWKEIHSRGDQYFLRVSPT